MNRPHSHSADAQKLRALHDRLGSMIDQVGHPDYSLREMIEGMRGVRDELFALSQSVTTPKGTYDEGVLAAAEIAREWEDDYVKEDIAPCHVDDRICERLSPERGQR